MSASTKTGQQERHPAMADVDERFQRFYTDRYAATVRLARLLTGDVHVAEDLTQDAFVKVYRYAETATRPIDNAAALLRTTTVNLCRSWHTRQQRAELRMSRHGPDATSLTLPDPILTAAPTLSSALFPPSRPRTNEAHMP